MRKKIKQLLLIVVISYNQYSCGYNAHDDVDIDHEVDKITVSEVGSFVLHFEDVRHDNLVEYIGRLAPEFVTSPSGKYHAFRDRINQHIVLTDFNGIIKQTAGKPGRGPGELLKAENYNFISDRELVVLDAGQSMFQFYSTDGEFLKSVLFQSDTYGINGLFNIYSVNGQLIFPVRNFRYNLQRNHAWQSPIIGVADLKGTIVRSIGNYGEHNRNPLDFTFFPSIDFDDKEQIILAGTGNSHIMQLFDLVNGEQLHLFDHQTTNYLYPKRAIPVGIDLATKMRLYTDTASTTRVFITKNYFIQYFQIMTESYFEYRDHSFAKHFIAVYDRVDYKYLGEIELSGVLGNIHDEMIFIISNNNPNNYEISIYEIQI